MLKKPKSHFSSHQKHSLRDVPRPRHDHAQRHPGEDVRVVPLSWSILLILVLDGRERGPRRVYTSALGIIMDIYMILWTIGFFYIEGKKNYIVWSVLLQSTPPLEEMKHFSFSFSFLRYGVEAKRSVEFRHFENEKLSVLTLGPICLPCCVQMRNTT